MKILVLYDGAGLARLGLEQAGHHCTGVEWNPDVHDMGLHVGSGNTILASARGFDISGFDAIWASPPCQFRAKGRTQGEVISHWHGEGDDLEYSLQLSSPILWVENVFSNNQMENSWGTKFNAAQFLETPIQNRPRLIGGRFKTPILFREYKLHYYPDWKICPTVTATEHKGCGSDGRRASRFYGRKLTIDECAYHQGFEIPSIWRERYTKKRIYEAIGEGVPVYMSKAFGKCY